MKTIAFLTAFLLSVTTLFGQGNHFNTTFFSPALDKEKMVRVYLPHGY